jgi:hypothetical protein
LLGVKERSGRIIAPSRLDEETMQTKQTRIVASGHALKILCRRVALTAELGSLRLQKECQRLARRDARSLGAEPSCGREIAGAHGN